MTAVQMYSLAYALSILTAIVPGLILTLIVALVSDWLEYDLSLSRWQLILSCIGAVSIFFVVFLHIKVFPYTKSPPSKNGELDE